MAVPGLSDPRGLLCALFDTAVAAVRPAADMFSSLPPSPPGRTIVLGAGKAAAAMAAMVEHHYTSAVEGLVIVPDGYGMATRCIEVVEAAHPLPDDRGMTAAKRILEMAYRAGPEDLVLCLISGGASSLLTLPAPGVTLDDKRAVTAALLKSGAAIEEVNCVRKHLSAVKGGRLAAAAAPASVFNLIISDVVGDDPAVIASGPTLPDPSTCLEALAVLDKYRIPIPESIRMALKAGRLETPKNIATSISTRIVARPLDALAAAAAYAVRQGLGVWNLGDRCAGAARDGATDQAALVRDILAGRGPVAPPCVVLSGGEFVVTVQGNGRGGPNTEFALALAAELDGLAGIWALAADTDGKDGAAGAAGAIT